MMKKKLISAVAVVMGLILLLSSTPLFLYAEGTSGAIQADADWPKRADETTPKGTEDDPFLVEDVADFMAMAEKRADKNGYAGMYIKLTADIDLNPGWDANSKTAPTTVWTAMWTFSGTLDGDGHTLKGLYAVANAYSGFIRNLTNGSILNLKVDNSYIKGTYAGFISCLKSGTAVLQNITFGENYIVEGTIGAGGLVGQVYSTETTVEAKKYQYDITECVFHGKVSTNGNYAGGFVGNSNGFTFNFANCYVDGTVTASGTYAGGLMANVSRESSVINCGFFGTVTSGTYAGGLVARTSAKLTVSDCSVGGTLSAGEAVAGVCANVAGITTLTRCYENADLQTATWKAGLLAENPETEKAKSLTDCYYKETAGLDGVVVYNTEAVTPASLTVTYTDSADVTVKTVASDDALLTVGAFQSNQVDYFGWGKYLGKVVSSALIDHFTGHDYSSVYHEETCVDNDYTVYTCKNCGYSYTVTGAKLKAHTSTGTVIDVEATATTGGKSHDVCAVCQQNFDEKYIPVEGAVYSYNANWENGTRDSVDKTYEISTAEDLMAFAYKRAYNNSYEGATVVLLNDIDLNPGWSAESGLVPPNVLTYLYTFDGTFEGNGHTISGLYCAGSPSANYEDACFINRLDGATIHNVKITNSLFTTESSYAGLFVQAINATVTDVYADVIVKGNKYVGGICAQVITTQAIPSNASTFENCVFVGTVTANQYAGGIVGWNGTATNPGVLTLKNCANYGTVNCPDCASALVGRTTGTVTLEKCLVAGSVTDSTKNGIITVSYQEASLTVSDTYMMGSFGENLKAVNRGTGDTYHLSYEGQTATEELYVTDATALVAKTEFASTWTVYAEQSVVLPNTVYCFSAGHQWEKTDKTVTATCQREGYTIYKCKFCNQTTKSDIQAITDHTPSAEWVIDSEPTEKRMGSKHLECSVCHEILQSEILPKLTPTTTETEANETEAEANTETKETTSSGGCGSVQMGILPLLLCAVIVLGVTMVQKKRKQQAINR